MRNGYYLIRDTQLDELINHDIAAYDEDTDSWAFVGDNDIRPNDGRYVVVKYICDPECTEIRA